MMGPMRRRTWAPKGQTPVLTQPGAHRQKVAVAAALGVSPRRDRLGLDYHTLADASFDNWYVTAFVEAMLKDRESRFVVIWDGGTMHKGEPISALDGDFTDRLCRERLPPFAPVLNPLEWLWSWLKWERLSNFAPHDLFHASELPLPRTLLF